MTQAKIKEVLEIFSYFQPAVIYLDVTFLALIRLTDSAYEFEIFWFFQQKAVQLGDSGNQALHLVHGTLILLVKDFDERNADFKSNNDPILRLGIDAVCKGHCFRCFSWLHISWLVIVDFLKQIVELNSTKHRHVVVLTYLFR